MSHLVSVRHNFETAHRLPHLGGKCQNLHGHSWWAEVHVAASHLTRHGTVVEFGDFKAGLRAWIDAHLDHGAMLGHADPLVDVLDKAGSKAFVFGDRYEAGGLDWPTVENVAVLLGRVGEQVLAELGALGYARVVRVRVTETHVNAAEWVA